jgi:hypothetical protein
LEGLTLCYNPASIAPGNLVPAFIQSPEAGVDGQRVMLKRISEATSQSNIKEFSQRPIFTARTNPTVTSARYNHGFVQGALSDTFERVFVMLRL